MAPGPQLIDQTRAACQLNVRERVVVCTMNTEERIQEQADRPLHFDAHEFDGLRDTLEKDAEGLFAQIDQYVRKNPWLCIGIAAAAGLALSCATRRSGPPRKNTHSGI